MRKEIILLVLVVMSVNLVFGASFCLDNEKPSPVDNLSISSEDNKIILNWDEAEDKPGCSDIDYYEIFRNNSYLTSVNSTSYTDNNTEEGNSYEYIVYPVDLGGNEGDGISESISLEEEEDNNGNGGGTSSSGGGFSITSLWECSDWSDCVNGTQTRECEDLREYRDNRTETKNCSEDFIPSDSSGTGGEGDEIGTMENGEGFSEGDIETRQKGLNSFITGMATTLLGDENQGKTLGYIGIAIGALLLAIIFIRKKKKS